jgi:sulfatase maturation enzyme AslB (radical SAM superfamily)
MITLVDPGLIFRRSEVDLKKKPSSALRFCRPEKSSNVFLMRKRRALHPNGSIYNCSSHSNTIKDIHGAKYNSFQ